MNLRLIIVILLFVLAASLLITLSRRHATITFPFTEPILRTPCSDSLYDALFIGTKAVNDSPYIFHLYVVLRNDSSAHGTEILTMTKPKGFSFSWKKASHELFIRHAAMTVRQYRDTVRFDNSRPGVHVIFIPPLDSAVTHREPSSPASSEKNLP